jgi:hypothetical protein
MWKDCKTQELQSKLQHLQWKGQEKEEVHVKDRDMMLKKTNIMEMKDRLAVVRGCQ